MIQLIIHRCMVCKKIRKVCKNPIINIYFNIRSSERVERLTPMLNQKYHRMKYAGTILITAVLLAQPFYSNAVRTILSGHIKNDPKETLTVQYYATPLDRIEDAHTQLEATVGHDGFFKLAMDIDKPVSINVMNGDSYLFINKFIGPGD